MPMQSTIQAQSWDARFFFDGAFAVRAVAAAAKNRMVSRLCNDTVTSYYEAVNKAEAETPHYWHVTLQSRFRLHPAVEAAVLAWRPKDWQQLLLEWPHVAETDPGRLAYTKDDRAGYADRQTVTTVGKYLRRHWPGLPDHIIRDLDARYNPRMSFKYETGIPALIAAVELGPRSCMQGAYGSIPWRDLDTNRLRSWLENKDCPEPDWTRHPYAVYDPRLGWGMATRTAADGEVMGRCLTWTDPNDPDTKLFVRSYARNAKGDSSCSGSDAGLESWLQSQGFEKRSEWPYGAKLLAIEHPTKSGYLVPYLDGGYEDDRRVSYYGAHALVSGAEVLEIDCDGDMTCDNTDGTATSTDDGDDEDMQDCDDCGAREYYGDMTYVGYHGDTCVCSSCVDDYVEVRAERGGRNVNYILPRSEACGVFLSYRQQRDDSPAYWTDPDHPRDNLIATDGGYADMDDVVRCTDDVYRFPDDPDVVELAEDCPVNDCGYAHQADAWQTRDGRWFSNETELHLYDGDKWPEDECWQCEGTGLWYPADEVEPVERNGMTVHPDYFDRCSRSAEWGDDAMAEAQEEIREEACEPEPPYLQRARDLVRSLIEQRVSDDHPQTQAELAFA